MRNVVITGSGAISAAGGNLEETLDTFERGMAKAAPVSLFPTDLSYPVFEVESFQGKTRGHEMRTLSLALRAVEEALRDAGLHSRLSGLRVGVCLGTTVASQLNDMDFYREYRRKAAVSMGACGPLPQGEPGRSRRACHRGTGTGAHRGERLLIRR